MKIICSWCGKHIEDSEGIHEKSHGVCEECKLFYIAEETTIDKLIEEFDIPVLLVNKEGEIKTGNKKALQTLDKTLEQVQFKRGGVVMDCPHSKLPEGCGNTIHCAGCDIRNSVMKTFETKESITTRAFMLYQRKDNTLQKVYYDISTKLVNDNVVLRIYEIGEV